jgi:hypothetical protein
MGRKLTNEAPCEQLNAVVPQFTVEVVNTTNDNTVEYASRKGDNYLKKRRQILIKSDQSENIVHNDN